MKKVLTREEFAKLTLKYVMGMQGDRGASRKYFQPQYQIHKETHTMRKIPGDIYSGWRKPKVAYYVTYDERIFNTADELYEAIFLTPWFNLSEHKPVRKGYYETDTQTYYWSGDRFNTDDIVLKWRGLNKVPYFKDAD